MEEEHKKTFAKSLVFINEAFELYMRRYKILLSISFVSLLPSVLVSVFYEESVFSSVMKTFGSYAAILIGAVMSVLFIIISSWTQIALIYSVKETEKKIDPSLSFSFAWRKLGSYWWIAFLSGFLFLGGFILFLIPGFLFAIWFSFVYYVLIIENEKGMNALLKSREYVRGKEWAVLWRFIILYFFNLLFAIPIGMLFGGIPQPWGPLMTQNFFSFLVVPFNIAYLFLVYRNLVEIKGDFVFMPNKKTKRIFFTIGTVGILLPFLLVGLSFLLFPLQTSRILLLIRSM